MSKISKNEADEHTFAIGDGIEIMPAVIDINNFKGKEQTFLVLRNSVNATKFG